LPSATSHTCSNGAGKACAACRWRDGQHGREANVAALVEESRLMIARLTELWISARLGHHGLLKRDACGRKRIVIRDIQRDLQ
jgi:hypothetical protein